MIERTFHRRGCRAGLAGLILGTALAVHGCASEPDEAASGLEFDRTTGEDGTTVVRNVSGSVWGEAAGLVEELSIGAEEGAADQMFGQIAAIRPTATRVYVLDRQAPALRAYDLDGNHLVDIGGPGQGPGEFRFPSDVAVLSDGTLLVQDIGNRRVLHFGADGETLGSWRPARGFQRGLTALRDGSVAERFAERPEEGEPLGPMIVGMRSGWIPTRAGQPVGDPVFPPAFGFLEAQILTILVDGVPSANPEAFFRPRHHWDVGVDGSLVAGVSDRYRFEIHSRDGALTVVERYHEPVAVSAAEASYAVERVEGEMRRRDPAWTFEGDPPERVKPPYLSLELDPDGRVWVGREIETQRAEDCVEDPHEDPMGARSQPCWRSPVVLDVFAPDGRYLGELRRPEDLVFGTTHVDGSVYWAAVEGADGVVTVRRFRIVTPLDT